MAVILPNRSTIMVGKEETPPEFEDFEIETGSFRVVTAELPPFPAKFIETNKDHLFWEWLKPLTQSDWNHLNVFMYREVPIIDRRWKDPKAPVHIDIFSGPFHKDTKEFLEKHGSGKYKLIINDTNRVPLKDKDGRSKNATVGTVRFEVSNPDYPPIFVLEELMAEHPSNKRIRDQLIAQGKLTIEGNVMPLPGSGTDNAALIGLVGNLITKLGQQQTVPRDATAESISSMYVKANETMMGMVKDQVKADDPSKLMTMLGTLKELLPKPENNNTLLETVLKLQGDAQARETVLLSKMFELLSSKPDAADAEDKVLDRMVKYKELFGGDNNPGTSNGKHSIWDTAIEHGAPVVLKIVETIQGVISMKNYQSGLNRQQQQAQQQQPNPQQVPAIGSETPQNAPIPESGPEVPQGGQDELAGMIKNGPAGALILGALQRGESGDNFAASLEGMVGRLVYDKIASLGKETIIASMASVPEFWSKIVPATIDKFVTDFIAYGQEDSSEGLELEEEK